MSDVKCPYCGHEQDIDHDDGYGYEEGKMHQQECSECEKTFAYQTGIIFHYWPRKADCLNGADHEYERTFTYPRELTKMRCNVCWQKRDPTDEEMAKILSDHESDLREEKT